MQKEALKQLIDDKFNDLITWLEAQPRNEFAVQKYPSKWSNGEHLEHLRKTTRAVNKAMKIPKLVLRYKFGKMNRAERSYETLKNKYVDKLKATGVKAPPAYEPVDITNNDRERLLDWFKQERDQMKKTVSKHSEKALGKYVIPHPVIGKLSFREFVYFTALHTEHHLDLMKKYNS